MSLAIQGAKNVVVRNWTVKQPQFWASIVIESENVLFRDVYINATSFNPEVSIFPRGWIGLGWVGWLS